MYNFNVKEQTENCIEWIRNWFEKNGNSNTKAIVGISGGKDSTVVAGLLVKALGKDHVFGVLMPCGEQVDISDSYKVVEHLGIPYTVKNIGKMYEAITEELRDLAPNGSTFPPDAYSTNTPARLRMVTLYSVGAMIGNCRVVNTCQISENINGYSTLWGDSVGDFAPIEMFTTEEVIAIGDYLELPYELTHKKPTDGMSLNSDGTLKGDEDKLGYSYEECNRLIRLGEKGKYFDEIMKKYNSSKFKMELIHIPHYDPKLPIFEEFK